MKYAKLLLVLLLFPVCIYSQSRLRVGEWKDHYSFHRIQSIAHGDGKIYGAGEIGIVIYDLSDNSFDQIGRVEGLSDVQISTIAFDENSKTLVVAYENGNIDLIKEGGIINAPDIVNKGIIGSTRINEITLRGDGTAYFSTDFGITLLSLETGLNLDSYFFQTQEKTLSVNDVAEFNDTLYAATDEGIYRAPNNGSVNLGDFRVWSLDSTMSGPVQNLPFNQIERVGNRLFTNYFSDVYPEDSLYFKDEGQGWKLLSDMSFYQGVKLKSYQDELLLIRRFGLRGYDGNLNRTVDISMEIPVAGYYHEFLDVVEVAPDQYWIGTTLAGFAKADNSGYEVIVRNSPFYNIGFKLTATSDDALFLTGGGINAQNSNLFVHRGFYRYYQGVWENYNNQIKPEDIKSDTLFDFLQIAARNANEFHVGSWGDGVLAFKNNSFQELYFTNNSPLQVRQAFNTQVNSGYLQYDGNGNLWVSNSYSSEIFKVLKPDGNWVGVNVGPSYGSEAGSTVKDFIITPENQIWITKGGNGLFAFAFGSNFEDPTQYQSRNFSQNAEQIPDDRVLSVARDLDGAIWIGTSRGPAVLYNPNFIFDTESTPRFQQIFIEQDGNVQIVLETEQINDIEIDGGNRKWFATQNSGIFLFSPDVTEQVQHITTENSPLLSNEIIDLAILPQSGELFVLSSAGLQSFKTDAIPAKESISSLNIYPNPIRPNYFGNLTIDGFVRDTQIKVTRTDGSLVAEIESLGGRATWDLKAFDGSQVGSGVYLLLATNADGSESIVDRVLVIRN
ncbi:MAG: hypothetical protein ACPF8V_03330 [Luteibaculum sp.]